MQFRFLRKARYLSILKNLIWMYICIVVNSEEGSRCLVMLISDPDKKSIRDWFGVINDSNVQASGSLSREIFGAVVSNGLDAPKYLQV